MLAGRDIAAEIRACIEDGFTDPAVISLRLGIDSTEVEKYLNTQRADRTPLEICREQLKALEGDMAHAQATYFERPTQGNATAIATFQRAWMVLLDRIAEYTTDDPVAVASLFDQKVFGPMVTAVIVAQGGMVGRCIAELKALLPPDSHKTMEEIIVRNYKQTGVPIKEAYAKSVAGCVSYFGADLNLDELRATAAVEAEFGAVTGVNDGKKRKKRKKRDNDGADLD